MRKPLINAMGWTLVFFTVFSPDLFAKKDYKGLFGSYRRDKYTENEGKATSIGVDFMLSTLFPLSNIVSSTEGSNASQALNYASFFNFDITIFLNLAYNWQFYGRFGTYNYETRRENTVITNPARPLFHQYSISAFPVLGGLRYRFGRTDLVPYVGIGAGIVYTDQLANYDYNTVANRTYALNLAAEATFGLEFYFSSNAGIRLEANAFFMALEARTYSPFSVASNQPNFEIAGNPWSIRYASGVFVLF